MSSSLLAALIFAFSLDCLFSNLLQQVSNHSFISESGRMEEQVREVEMTDARFKKESGNFGRLHVCRAVNTAVFL